MSPAALATLSLHSSAYDRLASLQKGKKGDQGGRQTAHFCINLRKIASEEEKGERGRQAAEDDKAPGAGHSTLSKLFRLPLLDEWSTL